MPGVELREERKHELLGRLPKARALTDELFRVVRPDSLYERPIPERHRNVFYVGHLEAFDWNLIGRNVMGFKPFHEEFDQLFAFGIDPLGSGLPTDVLSDWPSISEIQAYNQRVREKLDDALRKASFTDPALPFLRDGYVLHVALEHRLMHAETFAYMLHQLPLERKIPQANAMTPETAAAPPRMIRIPAGMATLGLPRGANGSFGWDNEFEAHTEEVPEFEIDAYNVTSGQYLEFLRAGGYRERSLWTEDNWEWKTQHAIWHPLFWVPRGDSWYYRTMFAEVPLPMDWPVYVSHAEASAYLRWAGKVLPTEGQLHRAAYGTPEGKERAFPWGDDPPDVHRGNFDFHSWDPSPVGSHPLGNSAFGVADLVGNGWEWTSTLFGPFPGFERFEFYPGYSANFFDGKHYVMKGGSARTAACMLRRSFRNWFQPHYPYIYAAFRGVAN